MSNWSKGILSVMMPAYNEARTIEAMLGHVLERPEVGEVIVVDDGSSDGTWDIAQGVARGDKRVRPLRLEVNSGKGAALRRAVQELRVPYGVVRGAGVSLRR